MDPHRIHHQRLSVRASSEDEALVWRLALRTRLDSEILPAFERAFEQCGVGDRVLRIPRLTLALEAASVDELLERLPALIARELSKAVTTALAGPGAPNAVRLEIAREHGRALLLEYLATGRLPWAESGLDVASVLGELRAHAEALVSGSSFASLPIPRELGIRGRTLWAFRLLQLLPDRSIEALSSASLAALRDAVGSPTLEASGIGALAAAVLHRAQPSTHGAQSDFVDSTLEPRRIGRGSELEARALELVLGHHLVVEPERWAALLAEAFEDTAFASAFSGVLAELSALAGVHVAERDARAQPEAETRACSEPPILVHSESDEVRAAGFLVNDAGLVLLHPFLPRLFTATSILDSNGKLANSALPRAAALLHYLATARHEVFEFELGLSKILLGLRLDDPLPVEAEALDTAARDEADALLAAVIDHWRALGRTTVPGLRASFLERRGILRPSSLGWQLQVEARSFDVLVASLPWAISIVKLPWMTRALQTTWPTA